MCPQSSLAFARDTLHDSVQDRLHVLPLECRELSLTLFCGLLPGPRGESSLDTVQARPGDARHAVEVVHGLLCM